MSNMPDPAGHQGDPGMQEQGRPHQLRYNIREAVRVLNILK